MKKLCFLLIVISLFITPLVGISQDISQAFHKPNLLKILDENKIFVAVYYVGLDSSLVYMSDCRIGENQANGEKLVLTRFNLEIPSIYYSKQDYSSPIIYYSIQQIIDNWDHENNLPEPIKIILPFRVRYIYIKETEPPFKASCKKDGWISYIKVSLK